MKTSGFQCVLVVAGMRGSTPLDVAAASVIDNNELALALQEQDLEKVMWFHSTYENMSSFVQSNQKFTSFHLLNCCK